MKKRKGDMETKEETVYAYIDSNNLNLGIEALGWKLDFKRFRVYLKEKYNVSVPDKDGSVKGNIDADLVLQAMIDYKNYDKAIIITSDGDFYSVVKYLYEQNKLLFVMSPYIQTCSALLKKAAKEKIVFMDNLRKKLEYKGINEKAPLKDET